MDKIILSSKDVETVLLWRDQNKDLVRRNPAPFKGIMLEFPDTHINIKVYNDAGKITFYLHINGTKAGKITGQQLPGGYFKAKKNTTKLKSDDVQSIITVYASLMALITYHKKEPAETAPKNRRDQRKKNGSASHKPRQNSITYIISNTATGARIQRKGSHASPAGVFSVRGHFRTYKNGKTVWIKPYEKGNGGKKDKTYKLN
jgi:hypothetical protein